VAEIVSLYPNAERRGLSPYHWGEALQGFDGIETMVKGGEDGYAIEIFLQNFNYSVHFHSDFPDGTYTGFNFHYGVECGVEPSLDAINEFNVLTNPVTCSLENRRLDFHWYVHLSNDELTESILKRHLHKWTLSLPAVAAFAHKFGD
jgi:hypothetical protein